MNTTSMHEMERNTTAAVARRGFVATTTNPGGAIFDAPATSCAVWSPNHKTKQYVAHLPHHRWPPGTTA